MAYRKLGVKSAHRRAMLRNMTTSLLKEGQIETTVTRAAAICTPAVRPWHILKKKMWCAAFLMSWLPNMPTVRAVTLALLKPAPARAMAPRWLLLSWFKP